MASSVYGIALTAASSGQDLQLAFLAYNRGSIYRDAGVGPERSPYVMNQSPGYTDMAWPEIPGEPLAGRTEYGRYGAWTVFVRLGGPGGSCAGLSNVDVVRVAQQELAAGIAEDDPGSDCDCGAPHEVPGQHRPRGLVRRLRLVGVPDRRPPLRRRRRRRCPPSAGAGACPAWPSCGRG